MGLIKTAIPRWLKWYNKLNPEGIAKNRNYIDDLTKRQLIWDSNTALKRTADVRKKLEQNSLKNNTDIFDVTDLPDSHIITDSHGVPLGTVKDIKKDISNYGNYKQITYPDGRKHIFYNNTKQLNDPVEDEIRHNISASHENFERLSNDTEQSTNNIHHHLNNLANNTYIKTKEFYKNNNIPINIKENDLRNMSYEQAAGMLRLRSVNPIKTLENTELVAKGDKAGSNYFKNTKSEIIQDINNPNSPPTIENILTGIYPKQILSYKKPGRVMYISENGAKSMIVGSHNSRNVVKNEESLMARMSPEVKAKQDIIKLRRNLDEDKAFGLHGVKRQDYIEKVLDGENEPTKFYRLY